MDKQGIAISTTTFYRPNSEIDVSRMGLAKDMVRMAIEEGHQVAVVDGGSPDYFLQDLINYGAHV